MRGRGLSKITTTTEWLNLSIIKPLRGFRISGRFFPLVSPGVINIKALRAFYVINTGRERKFYSRLISSLGQHWSLAEFAS